MSSAQDFMSFNADSIFEKPNFTSSRQSGSNFGSSGQQRSNFESFGQHRSDFGSSNQQWSDYGQSIQQRPNIGSSNRSNNSAWESGQNAFDDRLLKRNERQRDDRRRDKDLKSSSQKLRQDSGSSRAAPRQTLDNSRPKSSAFDSKPASSSTTDQKKNEKYPDIGEPKIKPKFADMFELVRKEDNGSCVYKCKVCNIDFLPDNNITRHLSGKKHRYFLKLYEDSLPGKTKYQKEKHLRGKLWLY